MRPTCRTAIRRSTGPARGRRCAAHAGAVRYLPGMGNHQWFAVPGASTARPQGGHRRLGPGRKRVAAICRGMRRITGQRPREIGRSVHVVGIPGHGRSVRQSAGELRCGLCRPGHARFRGVAESDSRRHREGDESGASKTAERRRQAKKSTAKGKKKAAAKKKGKKKTDSKSA